MKKTTFLLIAILLLAVLHSTNAQEKVSPSIKDALYPAKSAQLSGFIAEKLNASFENRIMKQDVDKLIAPFQNRTEDRCWQSEFWGKWLTSAVLAYRYRPEPLLKAVLDKAVSGLIASQSPDGYIGNYAHDKHLDQWDIWGRKYCMLGLISYYDLTKDRKSLLAAGKIADHLIGELADRNLRIVNLGNHHGMAASSVLEPICLLYVRTGEKRYLSFAEEIVRQWESPGGPQLISKSGTDVSKRFPKPENWWGWEQGQKAYEMMSCYEGLLELYCITGRPEYLKVVEKTWQNIFDTEINITGSGSGMECWFGGKQLQTMPVDHYQETCVTATWIKLSQQLLRLTGKAKYAEAIEQTWYNALLGAMYPDGSDWAKYSPLSGQRLQGGEQCGMGLNCCVASGPRALFTLPLTAVMNDKQGVHINFFVEGKYQLVTPAGNSFELEQNTDYPLTGTVNVKLKLAADEKFIIRIRIPEWSHTTVLMINDKPQQGIVNGDYAEIESVWKTGDRISLSLDMRGRVVEMGEMPRNLAIIRGPIVLARDARLGSIHVDQIIKPVSDQERYINLKPSESKQEGIWMSFEGSFIIESHKEGENLPVQISLCDYSSAGNTYSQQSWFRVWLLQSFNPSE